MPWRPAAKVGALFVALMILSELNQWQGLDRQYDTSIPFSTWRLYEVVSLVVVPLLAGLLCWLLAGLATSLYPEAWQLLRGCARRVWRRDAALCIVLVLAADAGLNKLAALFASRFHTFAPVDIEVFPDLFNAALPGTGFFLRALEWSVVFVCGLGLAIYIIRFGWTKRAWWLWAGILLGLVGLGPASAHSVREFFAGWVISFVPLAVAVAIVFWFFRNNLLAYLGAAFCLQVAQPLVSLLSQQAAFYRSNGLLLAVLAFLFLVWLLLVGRQSEPRSEP
jgi:MFS family permease